MISEKMKVLVEQSSVIRAMFEEGKNMAKLYGAENVYDFSLGNPSVNPPRQIKDAIKSVVDEEDENLVHGYMNNSGYEDVRDAVANSLNTKFGTNFSYENILMTVGAAGGLNVVFKTLLNPGDEVVVFAPFFGEYRNYVSNFDAKLVVVPPNTKNFMPDMEGLGAAITAKTKIVLINTPNNPTGVVYDDATLKELAKVLQEKEAQFNMPIYLVADEPYRELAYDNVEVPYVTKYYTNTIVGYSYSKSLSLPGERIGYLVIPSEITDAKDIISAAGVANRILGFVNAPSLIQRVVLRCLDVNVDVEVYNRNRELLYNSLKEYGYECVKPQGAFYLFVKTFDMDDKEFVAKAKSKNILVVPGSSFGCPGYVRIAYCVDYDMIKRSLKGFEELAQECK